MPEGTIQIGVQGHVVEVTGVNLFVEGHVVNANEANALNQLRVENVRNNVASKIKKAAEEAGVKPEDLDLDKAMIGEGDAAVSLRQFIEDYARNYEFGVRAVRSTEPVDPVEREALRIAKDTIRAALKAKGIKIKDLEEGQFENLAESLAQDPEVIAEAKRRVKAADKLGQLSLPSLGGDEEGQAAE